MIRLGITLKLAILAVLCMGVLPMLSLAETVVFRNECTGSVILQVATVQKGVLKRDQVLLRTGETTGKIALDSDKLITVQDSKTGRVLFRDALRMSKVPLAVGITHDARTGRVKLVPK